MRLKKQLSGGRVPHLLRGQGKARGALSTGALEYGAWRLPPSPGHAPGLPQRHSQSSSDSPLSPRSHATAAHLTRGMWSSVQQEPGPSMPHDWL